MATSKSTSGVTTAKKSAPQAKKSTTGTAKAARKPSKAKLVTAGMSSDERMHMIAEAAYYRAEQRGFNPEGQVDDWLQAEAMIDEMLSHATGAESSQRH